MRAAHARASAPARPSALPVSGRSPRDSQLQMLVGCGRHRAPSSSSRHPQCTPMPPRLRCDRSPGAVAKEPRPGPTPSWSASRASTGAGGGQTSEPAWTCKARLRCADWGRPKDAVTSRLGIGATRCRERRSPGSVELSCDIQQTDQTEELEAGSVLKLCNWRSLIMDGTSLALGQWRNG